MIQVYRYLLTDGVAIYPRRIWGKDFVEAQHKATQIAANQGLTVYGYEFEGRLEIGEQASA